MATQSVKVRQVRNLLGPWFSQRFEIVSQGIKELSRYAALLMGEAEKAHDASPMAAELTSALAVELGGKAMILLDFIRPPANVSNAQLPFYKHEAAEIYDWVYQTHYTTFGELEAEIARKLAPSYFEGDYGSFFDVAANWLTHDRETRLYPDLHSYDGAPRWETPILQMLVPAFGPQISACLPLLAVMERDGFVEPDALRILAEVWVSTPLLPDAGYDVLRDRNREFVKRCVDAKLVTNDETAATIVNDLRFPMCGIRVHLY